MEVNDKLKKFIEEWSYEMENFDKEFFREESFEINDPVIRKWNNQLYYICYDIDNGGEYLLGKEPNTPFNKCKVCELPSNLSHAKRQKLSLGIVVIAVRWRCLMSNYKVGDKIVLLNWDNNSEIYNIKSVYEHKIYDGNQHSYSTFVYLLDGWCYERWFNNREVRNANDEEIKVWKRL